MAKTTRKKAKKNISEKKVQKGISSQFKFTESYTSLIFGAIVVLVVGILFIFLAKGNRDSQTSSATDIQAGEQESNASSTYTVNPGDDLWSISENVYKDGYKWVEIAKINNLENPGLIHSGNKLVMPTISPNAIQTEPIAQEIENSLQSQNSATSNSSIVGSEYTVVTGDNLWDIAVRAYGDGFKWPEIAKANNLENPDLIFSGNALKIPR